MNVREHLRTDDKVARNVDRANRIAARLGQLVEALLEVSRIATGAFKLNLEAFDLGDTAREVVDRLRDSATAASCELSLEVAGAFKGAGTDCGSSRC